MPFYLHTLKRRKKNKCRKNVRNEQISNFIYNYSRIREFVLFTCV